MTTTAPRADGRVLALAHHAARARLEGVLTRHGITFHQSVTLRAVVAAGGAAGRDELVGDVVGSLKTEASVVSGVIGELTSAKLLEADLADPAAPARVRLTDAGRELYEATSAESAEVTARLYAGLTDEELEVTGRVLTLITERANAELAAGA
ncbi:DNA-binding MarR family transcriptional regulator [Streptomyces sp. PvR006]|uniref:winged helix DNA-binding protein n=1 Tax=Streptomyces sp. PvR006 TaxID=2817860 RepID=UPI001AE13532|nr:winged helix DNA-binding protein [Streptomyces sp. PvR006]MBP2586416.1 DNA-binding MarR family transcriptional regulator [Streptomyces sp. PvR006]